MAGERFWGEIPSGFKKISTGGKTMVVREELEPYLNPETFVTRVEGKESASRLHGRGKLSLLRLGNGVKALVRKYHHGGVLRRLTGDLFFTWPPRPFKELATTEEARRRGVPTLETLGACVERVWGPFYRGWLVTRELEGAEDLWAALQSDWCAGAARESCLRAVAAALRRMHGRGIYHRDLNLKNILVRREGESFRSTIIDFDKAGLFATELPEEKAQKNLRRLLRSVCKLDLGRRYLSQQEWDLFMRLYRQAKGA